MGCLLNMDATPARMTVFVDGEPLETQCEYEFPKDGRAWFPSVAAICTTDFNTGWSVAYSLFSCHVCAMAVTW